MTHAHRRIYYNFQCFSNLSVSISAFGETKRKSLKSHGVLEISVGKARLNQSRLL